VKIVAVSGNFDPIHVGHLHLIQEAKKLGDYLLVILTRDEQAIKKKGYVFMPYAERKEILESIKGIDKVVENVDEDVSSCKSLAKYQPNIYARGGDSLDKYHLVESGICKLLGIQIEVGIGGFNKEQSSSKLVSKIKKCYAIDVDGILCHTRGNDYKNSQPKLENIYMVNFLYNRGNYIKIFTARGSTSKIDWRELTEKQLKEWGVKYHELIMGKPSFDILIDDKARRYL
jgi:cytidyltransferase-like protein